MSRDLRILFGYAFYRDGLDQWYDNIISCACDGLRIKKIALTINPPNNRLSWDELDHKWLRKDKDLIALYKSILSAAKDCDVFINYNGINIHPEFLQYLPTKNVYCCFDDPESSKDLSEPVAKYYDAVFFGNISSEFLYASWGCKKIAWLPIFCSPSDLPTSNQKTELLTSLRSNDIIYVGEKNWHKSARLVELLNEFPNAKCFGRKGWDYQPITDEEKKSLYGKSKIGWNIHNTTGPINIRMFMLPAYGVLQICDNKAGLGKIFKLGEEAVGFSTIPEAIELTEYYLTHENERKEIAAGGYARFWADYHPNAIWKRVKDKLSDWELDTPHPNLKQFSVNKKFDKHNWLKIRTIKSQKIRKAIKGIINYVNTDQRASPQDNTRFDDSFYLGKKITPYLENPELGSVNLSKTRIANGQPIEWPNIVALNWAVTALVRNEKNIIEVGSGTGAFANFISTYPGITLDCFENDDYAREYAINRCKNPKISFYKDYSGNLKERYELLVAIEVIEHISDISTFLSFCKNLSPKAIFSTPNRNVLRGESNVGPPDYLPHVREYSPGEIYWLLKQFYEDVYLYYMPNVYIPWLQPMTIATMGTPIIAHCINPN